MDSMVLTTEKKTVLNEGIGLILSRWTAMRAAVDNGWGGRDSREKAERTVSSVFDYFIQSKVLVDPLDFDVAFDGVADILEAGLVELNTVADDGSVDEVTEKLLDLYEDCRDGIFKIIEKLRVTKSQTSASVVKAPNGNKEDEESDDEDEDTCMNNAQTTAMMVDGSESGSCRKAEAMTVDEPAADDGWTVVPSRKNKNKRN